MTLTTNQRLCRFCWERWRRKRIATKVVAGDLMCGYCFGGGSGIPEESVRERRPEAHKGAWANPQVRARLGEAMRASWANPEVRARRRAAIKAAWANPEVRARLRAAMKAAWANPEVRARLRAAVKAAWARRRKESYRKILDARIAG
jgi:hypothetical protein